MTNEEIVWRWLKLTERERQSAARRMLDDGRIELGKKLELVPVGAAFSPAVCEGK